MSWYLISVVVAGSPASLAVPPGTHLMTGPFGTEQVCTQAAEDTRRNYDAIGIKDGLTLQCVAAEAAPD